MIMTIVFWIFFFFVLHHFGLIYDCFVLTLCSLVWKTAGGFDSIFKLLIAFAFFVCALFFPCVSNLCFGPYASRLCCLSSRLHFTQETARAGPVAAPDLMARPGVLVCPSSVELGRLGGQPACKHQGEATQGLPRGAHLETRVLQCICCVRSSRSSCTSASWVASSWSFSGTWSPRRWRTSAAFARAAP